LKEQREMMASISDPMKSLRASLALISDPLKEHREMMASISNPMKNFQASLASIPVSFRDVKNASINSVPLKSIRDIAFEVQADIEIGSEGEVSLSSKRISAIELQELSDTIFHNSSLEESNSLEDSINNLINEIRNDNDPLTQKILICFVYPLIVIIIASFITPIVDYHVKAYIGSNKRALEKELKSTVNSAIDDKYIVSTFRYVSADTLNVRISASVKSEIIGYLHFSSTVLIIEKQKSWTLIEWNNPESEAKITGWVFSRYLAKFR